MGLTPGMPPRFNWAHLPTVGLGVFTGAFWLVYGFSLTLNRHAVWWQHAVTMAPGAAVLLLVLLARRHPVPYGAGLIALGMAPLLFGLRSGWEYRLGFGLPLLAAGLGFILWRRCFSSPS